MEYHDSKYAEETLILKNNKLNKQLLHSTLLKWLTKVTEA